MPKFKAIGEKLTEILDVERFVEIKCVVQLIKIKSYYLIEYGRYFPISVYLFTSIYLKISKIR